MSDLGLKPANHEACVSMQESISMCVFTFLVLLLVFRLTPMYQPVSCKSNRRILLVLRASAVSCACTYNITKGLWQAIDCRGTCLWPVDCWFPHEVAQRTDACGELNV